MPGAPADPPSFLPAQSHSEAIERIYSLTGAASAGTRGEKRAILALRDALELDVDVTRTSAVMGSVIADAMGIEWRPSYTDRNKVNLGGLNALLGAATRAYHRGALRRLAAQRPIELTGPQWAEFEPARSKIEAVNRISALTGSGPEWLGPGSKEHKRVLVNLARGLAPALDTDLSKTKLGAALAKELGVPWSDACESTGETIRLIGLNTILAGAERRLGRLGVDRALAFGTPEAEATALTAALVDGWTAEKQADGGRRVVWDARACIGWMLDEGVTNGPSQNEWQGFYWEARGRALLNRAFTPSMAPPPIRYGNTAFDYALSYVWDLKAHTEVTRYPISGATARGRSDAPLNDKQAMDECIDQQGLGFLVVGGIGVADEDGSFVDWHRALKIDLGVRSRPSNTGASRMRKAAFEPLQVEAFFFHDRHELDAAIAAGHLTAFSQGRQAPSTTGGPGRDRRPKYNLAVSKVRRSDRVVARSEWPRSAPPPGL